MNNLQHYAHELAKLQEMDPKAGRIENPVGVCDTLWIPTHTGNRSATVNLNHTLLGFDKEGQLWGENGNCGTKYLIIELPESFFSPDENQAHINYLHDPEIGFREKGKQEVMELGRRLIQRLNKSYNEPLLVIKADDRLPVIKEVINQMANEN